MDPFTYEEAAKDSDWIMAMIEEIEAIRRNGTWELTNLLEKKKAIGLKWIFKSKLNPDGSLLNTKARLVAKGFSQRKGIDFEEVFSPATQMETVRLFLPIGAQKEWSIYQLDVKSAFLNGELKEKVFVSQLKGFISNGKEEQVYKLHKALYRLCKHSELGIVI